MSKSLITQSTASRIYTKTPAIISLITNLKSGLGANKLKNVNSVKLHVNSLKMKLFWREILPKLAYNNKDVEFGVVCSEKFKGDGVLKDKVKVVGENVEGDKAVEKAESVVKSVKKQPKEKIIDGWEVDGVFVEIKKEDKNRLDDIMDVLGRYLLQKNK